MLSPTSSKGASLLHRNHITTRKISRPQVIVWLVVVITFYYLFAQVARIWPDFSYNPVCALSLPALTPAACKPSPPHQASADPTTQAQPTVQHYKIEDHLHTNRPTPTPLPGRRYDPVTGKPLTPAGNRDAAAYLIQNYGDVPVDPFTKRPFDSFVDDMAEPRVQPPHKDSSKAKLSADDQDTAHNDLRILPLGDSITLGLGSHDFTGYRKHLHQRLVADHNKVTMVGSLRNGSMENNDHDGWWGTDIAVIGGLAAMSYSKRPNVVLLHAGTNDIKYYGDNQEFLDLAPARLGDLVDQVHLACPDAVVLVAKIIRSGSYWAPLDRVLAFNEGVEREMLKRIATGKHVVLVDAFSRVAESDMYDPKHPTDEGMSTCFLYKDPWPQMLTRSCLGYAKLAEAWYEGIETANRAGWIESPVPVHVGVLRTHATAAQVDPKSPGALAALPISDKMKDELIKELALIHQLVHNDAVRAGFKTATTMTSTVTSAASMTSMPTAAAAAAAIGQWDKFSENVNAAVAQPFGRPVPR